MPRRPIIGITLDQNDDLTKYELPHHYARSIADAGGVPVLLPYATTADPADQLDVVDGLLLTGGNDLDPTCWGEACHKEAEPVDARRERHERALIAEAQKRDMPMLGICFGMQLMNIMRGGSLHQHLPDIAGRCEHRKGDLGWGRRHAVKVTEGSLLAAVVGAGELEVNTSHHQGVNRIGEQLKVTARAEDGTVEALEDPRLAFWLGVQWHPERMTPEDERQVRLFRRLVEAAGARRERRR